MTPIETINDDHEDEAAKIVNIGMRDYHKQAKSLDFGHMNSDTLDTPTIDINDNNYIEQSDAKMRSIDIQLP